MAEPLASSTLVIWPLENASEAQFRRLCQVLWDWDLCNACKNGQPCVLSQCPWKRSSTLRPFFRFYEQVTSLYVPEIFKPSTHHALRNHEDLFDVIQTLRKNQAVARANLTAEYFARRGKYFQPDIADQNRAFDLAIRIMTTVCCSIEFEPGSEPLVWHGDKSFQDFVGSIGNLRYQPTLVCNYGWSLDTKEQLTAARLKKVANLRFRVTDNLRNHLRLEESGIVEIFCHTSILKEHLRATRDGGHAQILIDATSRGIIPRQLALETLDSLQKILFPFGDIGSHKCLEDLASSSGFDRDCLIPSSADCRRGTENNTSYTCWGSRLGILLHELENPRPRGFQERWERMSKQRHMMQVAVIGIIAAVILGFMGVALQTLQVWISFQQLKYSTPTRAN